MDFDLACWFTGEAAGVAAAEDGAESPPPNGYYVRNNDSTVRSLEVGSAAEVVWYPNFGDPSTEAAIGYGEWVAAWPSRGLPAIGVWVTVDGGVVSAIAEQWVP
jgi:hypothetical protein